MLKPLEKLGTLSVLKTGIFSSTLYACKTWAMTEDWVSIGFRKKYSGFGRKYYRKIRIDRQDDA